MPPTRITTTLQSPTNSTMTPLTFPITIMRMTTTRTTTMTPRTSTMTATTIRPLMSMLPLLAIIVPSLF